VNVDCAPFGSCEDGQFELADFCLSNCEVTVGEVRHCSGFSSVETLADTWAISSQLFFWGPPFIPPAGAATTGLTVEATRVSPQLLDLQGLIDSGVYDPSAELDPGPVEVSVFRFSGDPTVFEGVDVVGVDELVALGLIQADDVLFSEVLMYTAGDSVPFDFSVDVTGVPDDEIVVFAAESRVFFSSTTSTPASSAWGLAVLVVGMLAAATWSRRHRFTRGSGAFKSR
jgi:MYXO-CTERM domain-containing protein